LNDSCGNSNDDQASRNVGSNNGGSGGGYNDDYENKDLALWYKNDHDFYITTLNASSFCTSA
jgi:hypothetical protein